MICLYHPYGKSQCYKLYSETLCQPVTQLYHNKCCQCPMSSCSKGGHYIVHLTHIHWVSPTQQLCDLSFSNCCCESDWTNSHYYVLEVWMYFKHSISIPYMSDDAKFISVMAYQYAIWTSNHCSCSCNFCPFHLWPHAMMTKPHPGKFPVPLHCCEFHLHFPRKKITSHWIPNFRSSDPYISDDII